MGGTNDYNKETRDEVIVIISSITLAAKIVTKLN
jgi:hypothetical protein